MKIVSFGDSFIFGSELKNNKDGSKAWPGLVATELGYDYETYAVPGCGNEAIFRQVLEYFAQNDSKNTLAVINWTWTQRWDFYVINNEKWITVGPTCVPDKLEEEMINIASSKTIVNFAQDYCISSLVWNKFRSLQTVHSALQYLMHKNINFICTYTDRHMFDEAFHAPEYITELQNLVYPYMTEWDGKTFLEWTDDQNFYKTETLHPLEDTHNAAKDFWKDVYKSRLENA